MCSSDLDADIVLDVRFLNNPHYVPALQPLTGKDRAVGDYIAADPDFNALFDEFCAWLGKFARQVPPEEQARIDAMRAQGAWPPPYTYIFTDFLPMLRERGIADADIDSMLIDNPRRFFSGDPLPT
mgnify:CR=1 FL=1